MCSAIPKTDSTAASSSLLAWARARGAKVAWGTLDALADANEDLTGRRQRGEIDPQVYATHMSEIRGYDVPAWATRVFVVALPRPAHRVRVSLPGGPSSVLLPPTYLLYSRHFDDYRRELEIPLAGARLEVCRGPLKAVASRLGLVEYGRNNVTFAPGLGSYMQLLGYVTDADLPLPVGWAPRAPKLMDACAGCNACQDACPTAAIGSDRVLLHTERCLTGLNEVPGDWPAGVPERAHHALVGCLRCQVRCPENPKLPIEPAGVELTSDECAAVLAGRVPPSVREKLRSLGQEKLCEVLPRNLRALTRRGAERGAVESPAAVA